MTAPATNGTHQKQIAQFMELVYGDLPENLWLLVWTLEDHHLPPAKRRKRSYWFQSAADAAAAVAKLGEKKDIYIGVGLSPRDFGPKRRCEIKDIAGLVGLWIDIDVAGPTHPKAKVADLAAAIEFAKSFPLLPTLLVRSGSGLHAWWLFKEPWVFDSGAERTKAIAVAGRFAAAAEAAANAKGFSVKGTFDISRVLRVPGTYNQMHGKFSAVPCTIAEVDPARRYDPSDFDVWLAPPPLELEDAAKAVAPSAPVAKPQQTGPLRLDPAASPPAEKLLQLFGDEPLAQLSWDHKRTDLADQTISGYDMSLASFAVNAGWTDQEVADLLIAHHRRYKVDRFIGRPDYFEKFTIAKARNDLRSRSAAEQLCGAADEPPPVGEDETPQQRRERLLKLLSDALGAPIRRIIKFDGDEPQFHLETALGKVMLGSVGNLIEQSPLRRHIAAAQGHVIPTFKPAKWHKIAQALLDVCEIAATGRMGTDAGIAEQWLAEYLEAHPANDGEGAIAVKAPVIRDGVLYIFLSSLDDWLKRRKGERPGSKKLSIMLKQIGVSEKPLNVKIGGAWTTRNVYTIPEQLAAGAIAVATSPLPAAIASRARNSAEVIKTHDEPPF